MLIDDECRALTDARHGRALPQDTESLSDFAVWVEIRAEWDFDHPDIFFLPRDVADDGIDADVQNLGIQCGELLPGGVEHRHLGGSSRSPVERVEGDDHILLAPEVTKRDTKLTLAGNGGEIEIRSWIAGLQGHRFSVASQPVLHKRVGSKTIRS